MHSKKLLQILKPLSPAIEPKPILPVRECVCIKDGIAYASGGGITISNKCDIKDIVINYRELVAVLSVIDEEITIQSTKDVHIIKAGKKPFSIKRRNDENEFPLPAPIAGDETKVNADFFYAIKEAAKNQNPDNINSTHGLYINSEHIVGTDGFVMFYSSLETGLDAHLPALFAAAVSGWNEGSIKTSGNHFVCSNGELTIDVLQLDMKYPDISVLLPVFKKNFSIERNEFEVALKQATVLGEEIISFTIDNNEVLFNQIPVQCKSELQLKINFNAAILNRIISSLPDDCDTLEFMFSEHNKPCYVVYKNITLLIMPFR